MGLDPFTYISVTITANLDYLAAINHSNKNGWFKEIATYVNAVNIMTYDLHGAWSHSADPFTQFHEMLIHPQSPNKQEYAINYGVKKIIEHVLSYGIPANKVQLGIASYGRGFSGVPAGSNPDLPGYKQPWKGVSLFSERFSQQADLIPYKSIPEIETSLGYKSYEVHADNKDQLKQVVGAYVYQPTAKQFVGYVSPAVVKSIREFVKKKGLQGAILWSTDADLPVDNPNSLVATYRATGSD